jgi:uncharacterized repeat protein (TIGR01451 family)
MIKRNGMRSTTCTVMICFLTVLLLFGLLMPVQNTAMAAQVETVYEPDEDGSLPSETREEPAAADPEAGENEAEPAPSAMAVENTLSGDAAILAVGDISVKNFFYASGLSTNGRYRAKGIYIAPNNDVHILLYLINNANYQDGFYDAMINGMPVTDLSFEFSGVVDVNATFVLPDGTEIPIGDDQEEFTVYRIADINIGQMADALKAGSNTLSIPNTSGGWSILISELVIDTDYTIEKNVVPNKATYGDELLYTISVSNLGNFDLAGVNVYDDVPNGITITGVSEDNINWEDPAFTSGDLILADGLNLADGSSRTYYIKAVVNNDANDGDVIVNTAFTGGSVPRKEATAEVSIEVKVNAAITKIITGNFGDLSREFAFTVTINDGSPVYFNLADGDTKHFTDLRPGDVLKLKEDAGSYEVTVLADEDPISPNDAGEYIITLSNEDTAITVTNHKNIIIDTGINLDSLPYLIILAVVIAGIAVIWIRRRRINSED